MEPKTPTGKTILTVCGCGPFPHAIHPGLAYILAIESEAEANGAAKERERLRPAINAVIALAGVSYDGDPWYAEQAGLGDGYAIVAAARAAIDPEPQP